MQLDRDQLTLASADRRPSRRSFIARYGTALRLTSWGLAALGALLLGRVLLTDRVEAAVQAWVEGLGVRGIAVTFGLYVVGSLMLFPASVLTLVAAAIYGFWLGTLIVSLAATTVAALAFLIGRYLARERVRTAIEHSPKLQALDQAIGEQGWKIVALMRLSPLVPFTLQNYLYGATAIRFWPCILISWVAMLPGTVMYVYLGSIGGRVLTGQRTSWTEWILRIVGILATLLVTWYLARLARRTIKQRTAIEDSPEAEDIERECRSRDPDSRRGQQGNDKDRTQTLVHTWKVIVPATVALGIMATAAWAYIQRKAVETFVNSWFGV